MNARLRVKEKLLNEEEIISTIWRSVSQSRAPGLRRNDPFADDVAWVRNHEQKKFLILKSDMFLSDTDAPKEMTPKQMGSKALTSCVSDFAAKGVRPEFALVSLAIPKRLSKPAFISSIANGLGETSRRYGFKILAGDTNSSISGVVIDCALLGFADSFARRRGSKPGDLVGVSGAFGLQSAGLKILLEGLKTPKGFRKRAVESVVRPRARLDLGLSIARYLTSSIDSSDGLAISLYRLAESSRVRMDLERVPVARGVKEFSFMNSVNEEDLALFGGEEFELVFTFEKEHEKALLKEGVIIIGSVTSRCGKGERPSISYRSEILPRRGWIHNS